MNKLNSSSTTDSYADSRFVLATSNICASYLSKAVYAVKDHHLCIQPANMEEQMFLHMNRDFKGLLDVQEIDNQNESKILGDTSIGVGGMKQK